MLRYLLTSGVLQRLCDQVASVELEVGIAFLAGKEDGHARFNAKIRGSIFGERHSKAALAVLDFSRLDDRVSEFVGHRRASLPTLAGKKITPQSG